MSIESSNYDFGVTRCHAVAIGRDGTEHAGRRWMPGINPATDDRERKSANQAGFLRWGRFVLGIFRAFVRLLSLVPILLCAVMDAAMLRLTTCPTALALARNRSAWLRRWSGVLCWILGIEVKRSGFRPVSGLVVVRQLTIIDALVLSSCGPCVFVADADASRRPIVGYLARLGGTLFWDRHRRNDVARINFLIGRALRRRQIVVISPGCSQLRGKEAGSFKSPLFQVALEAPCALTAAAMRYEGSPAPRKELPIKIDRRPLKTLAHILPHSRLLVVAAFNSPKFHRGDRKELAAQLWREVRTLEQVVTTTL